MNILKSKSTLFKFRDNNYSNLDRMITDYIESPILRSYESFINNKHLIIL